MRLERSLVQGRGNGDCGRGVVNGQLRGGRRAVALVIAAHRRQEILAIGHRLPIRAAGQDASR